MDGALHVCVCVLEHATHARLVAHLDQELHAAWQQKRRRVRQQASKEGFERWKDRREHKSSAARASGRWLARASWSSLDWAEKAALAQLTAVPTAAAVLPPPTAPPPLYSAGRVLWEGGAGYR